jgi:hypothetical protein
MEVGYCRLDVWEVVDIVDGFLWVGSLLQKYIEFVRDCFGGRNVEVGVEAAATVWAVEEDSVSVFVGDIVCERDTPQLGCWASTTL